MGEFSHVFHAFCSVVRRLNQLRIDGINVLEWCVYQYYHINTQTVEEGKKTTKIFFDSLSG